MSLHRVSSIESWERRGTSPAAVEHRKMSFNPVGQPPELLDHPLATIEVSRVKRFVQVALACTYCFLAAGVVFGYAALKPVLVEEGVYRELCPTDDPADEVHACYEQEIRLNLMFTIAAVATNVAALPVGTVLDKFGPKVTGIVGSFFLAVGSIFMVVAPKVTFDAYSMWHCHRPVFQNIGILLWQFMNTKTLSATLGIPGYLFLALGGPFVFISSFQLSNCFPRHSGLILGLLTGAFDTSSAIFLLYRLVYNHTHGDFKPDSFFTGYLVVPASIFLVQLFIMPDKSYQTPGELVKAADSMLEGAPLGRDTTGSSERARLESQRNETLENIMSEISPLIGVENSGNAKEMEARKRRISKVWGALHGFSAMQQILSPWWIFIALFVMIQMTRINYFVATIRSQYTYLLHDYSQAVRVNNVFDILLPVGGVVSIPFIGLVLDNFSTPFTLGLLVTIATAIGVFGVLPYEAAAYVNVVLFVLYRPLYYTAVSDYAAKVFGFHTFGKVYGLIICVSGLFNFSQSMLDALTHQVFDGNPVPVNVILLVMASVVGLTLVVFVQRKGAQMSDTWSED